MNLTEIPTPRVDSEIRDMGTDGDGDAYLHVSFCRQLEREAAAWRAVAEMYRSSESVKGSIAVLKIMNAADKAFDALKAQLTKP